MQASLTHPLVTPTSYRWLPRMYPVFSIQVPDPFFEGQTAIYVIQSDPLTMIDTGISTDECYATLLAGLAEHNVSLADVGRVILTHKHIDHIGNAWRIQQATGAEVLIHESEIAEITQVDADAARFKALAIECLDRWNVPREIQEEMDSVPKWQIESVPAKELVDAQEISLGDASLTVVHTPGHSRGSICLKYGDMLFSGDHVLPDISPNIGAGDLLHPGLLRMFFASLEKIQRVGADLQIMPGHGQPFSNLSDRCRVLTDHHVQRLDEILSILQIAQD